MTFYIKQGDTSPSIEYQLQDDNGDPVDITGYQDVEFHFRKEDVDSIKVNDDTSGNVSVTDAANGKVKYEWQTGDTDQSGRHVAEWQVTYDDGSIETFPNRRDIDVRVEEEIA